MALKNGYIKLNRKILEWRWYKNGNTIRLFIHLLLTANISDKDFEGLTIKRGQKLTSYPHVSAELGMTIKEVRTALEHLKKTGEVAVSKYPKYSVITVLNYDRYQEVGSQGAVKGQAEGSQGAVKGQQYKKNKKNKEEKEYTAPPGAKKTVLGKGGGHTDF
ncbi:hypothetical protein [Porcipelethomonas sp.]|uniref:hypothetical protein n=1 Tax=Porcipelethomonas sp. TaxID=2981675 RepID=UPI003EF27543